MRELKSMSDAVKVVIDSYKPGHRFHGNQLKEDVVRIYPGAKDNYVDTIQRMMRRHCRLSYKTIDQNHSLYEKVAPHTELIKEEPRAVEKQYQLFETQIHSME